MLHSVGSVVDISIKAAKLLMGINPSQTNILLLLNADGRLPLFVFSWGGWPPGRCGHRLQHKLLIVSFNQEVRKND
jgi:hypothetical protein